MLSSVVLASAYHNARRRPLRSVLTVLQICIGVACVVSVLSYRMNLSAGINRMARENEDIVVASGGSEVRTETGGWMRESYAIFSDQDAMDLAASPDVEAVSPVAPRAPLVVEAGGNRYLVRGGAAVGPDYARVYGLEMAEGAFIAHSDVESRSNVVVISESLARALFGGDPPYVGKTLTMLPQGVEAAPQKAGVARANPPVVYKVIGVFRDDEARTAIPFISPMRDLALMVWPTTAGPSPVAPLAAAAAKAAASGAAVSGAIAAKAYAYPYTTLAIRAKAGRSAQVKELVKSIVSGRTRPGQPQSVVMADIAAGNGAEPGAGASEASVIFETPADTARMFMQALSGAMLILGGAVLIALIVSGIGILSIMMVSVVERSREVGLRRALGASRAAIVLQFTSDSVALSLAGGVLGVAASVVLYPLLQRTIFAGASVLVGGLAGERPSALAALVGLGIAALFGALFGLVPAFQAAKVEPAEILREL